jgi:AraC-like DNA-binding protein
MKREIEVNFPGVFLLHQKVAGNRVEFHTHEGHELFFPQQGEISITVEGEELHASPGKMIYLPPGVEHSFTSSAQGSGERLIVVISKKAWNTYKTTYKGGKVPAKVCTVSQLSKELIFHLLLHPKTKAVSALLSTLVQTLSETLELEESSFDGDVAGLQGYSSDDRIKKAVALLKRDPAKNISTAKLARESGLSLRSLNRLFLQELGLTPKKLVLLLRVELAKKLLSSPRATVTDTAFEVGYQSVSQFIAAFQRVTGQLPSEYQRAHGKLS